MSSLFESNAAEQPARKKRGRGATPKTVREVTPPRPSPTRQHQFTLSYRRLKTHAHPRTAAVIDVPDELWEQAEKLITIYFCRLGGFRVARCKDVIAALDALLLYSAEDIEFGLAAKADSLRGDNRAAQKFRCRPCDFFKRYLDTWIDRSPDRQRRDASADTARRMDAAEQDRTARIADESAAAVSPEERRQMAASAAAKLRGTPIEGASK